MESSSTHMASILKIESSASGWVKSLGNLLNTITDVDFKIDKRSKTVYVYGKTSPEIILEKITKAGQKAEIVWSDHGRKKPMDNKSGHTMEQCYSSGYSNYHPGPPPNWMYQPPPHYQTFALPPPYPRQLHPQPQLLGFQPKEPVAKSFPPTPAPPKNFTMGDLHLGCRIM